MASRKDPVIPVADAATELGIAHSTFARQVRDGRVPGARKVGAMWLVSREGIDYYRRHSLGRPGLPSGTKLPSRRREPAEAVALEA